VFSWYKIITMQISKKYFYVWDFRQTVKFFIGKYTYFYIMIRSYIRYIYLRYDICFINYDTMVLFLIDTHRIWHSYSWECMLLLTATFFIVYIKCKRIKSNKSQLKMQIAIYFYVSKISRETYSFNGNSQIILR